MFVRIIRRTGLAMDEPKHTMGSEPDMVSLSPFCICATIRYVGGEHCPQICHLLTTVALGETFGIYGTLLCLGIKEFTPGIQIYDQHAPIHSLLMTAEAALGALVLPS